MQNFSTNSFSYLILSLLLSLQINVNKRPKLILNFHQRVECIKLEEKRKVGLGYIRTEGNYILIQMYNGKQVNLSLCLRKHHASKTHRGVEVELHAVFISVLYTGVQLHTLAALSVR
jgi:hypothetical protein